MENSIGIMIGAAIAGGILGFLVVFFIRNSKLKQAQAMTDQLLENAHTEARLIEEQAKGKAKDTQLRAREDFDQEVRQIKRELQKVEQKLDQREEKLDQRQQSLQNKERSIEAKEGHLAKKEEELERKKDEVTKIKAEMSEKLAQVASLPMEEAKAQLLNSLVEKVKLDNAEMFRKLIDEAKAEAEKDSKRILSIALQRNASDYSNESSVASVTLTNEEMKGRIIGKEGRNIRAIEAETGVDLIIDDTPEVIVVSSFDPVRRAVAKTAIERLMSDGRIHPARIEEVVNKVKREIDNQIAELGEKACVELGLTGVHQEIQKLIGTLNFRTSYGQNQYYHSIEVAHLCGMMGAELGLNIKDCRRAGLMHDIGKALDHSMEGSHAMIGADMALKYGERDHVVYAIRAHHEEVKPKNALDFIVMAGDAISGARPGARRDMVAAFQNRMKELEDICYQFDGVERCYAVQAGREVRVMVDVARVTDDQSVILSQDIAKKIENELTYPGQVKVTVIREIRAVGLAK